MRHLIAAASAACALAFAGSAAAAVVNGDFEAGYDGWSTIAPAFVGDYADLSAYGATGTELFSGNAAWFLPTIGNGDFRQLVDTVPGVLYELIFDLAVIGEGQKNINVGFGVNGMGLSPQAINYLPGSFQRYSLRFRAISDQTLVQFNQGGIGTGKSITVLDNISVVIPAHVPEPATWAMMIIGFGAVGCALRRPASGSSRRKFQPS